MSNPLVKVYDSYEWYLKRFLETGQQEVVTEACRELFRAWQQSTPGAARMAELHLDALRRSIGAEDRDLALPWSTAQRAGEFLTRVLSALDALREGSTETSHHDRLTGLPNRLSLVNELASEAARAIRHARPLSVASITLSGFERFPESVGDAAIFRLAQSLDRVTRREDRVFRAGPTDFAIVLPDTPSNGAQIASQRIADGINEQFSEREVDSTPAFDAHFGVATMPNEVEDPQALLDLARRRAHEIGGVQVQVWADVLNA